MAALKIELTALAGRRGGDHNADVKSVCGRVVAGELKAEDARKAVETLCLGEDAKNGASRVPQLAATALRSGVLTPEEAGVALNAVMKGQAGRILGAQWDEKVKVTVGDKTMTIKAFNDAQDGISA